MADFFEITGGCPANEVFESTHDSFEGSKFSNWLANSAGLGIYAHGRVHQQVGALIYVGDLIHKRGGLSTEDLLLMEEQALPSYGDPLSVNSRLGELMALLVLPAMNTANGEGDLIAYYEAGVVSFNTAEAPRETRVSGEGEIVSRGWDQKRLVGHLLNTISSVGRYAVAVLPRDHFFRSAFGLHFLKTVIGEGSFNTEQTNRISMDVDPLLLADDPALLHGTAAGYWIHGNRMFATTGMTDMPLISSSPVGRGFVSWNQATRFTEDRTPIPAWEGLWTVDNGVDGILWFGDPGIRPTSGAFGFLASGGGGELFFASIEDNASSDYRDGADIPIEWNFETGQFAGDGLASLKILKDGRLEGVFSKASARLRVLVRTDMATEWVVWNEFTPCDDVAGTGQELLLSMPLGSPPKAARSATWFQVRVEGLGAAEIRAVDIDYSTDTVKAGRRQCVVTGPEDTDPFEINTNPSSTRWS